MRSNITEFDCQNALFSILLEHQFVTVIQSFEIILECKSERYNLKALLYCFKLL